MIIGYCAVTADILHVGHLRFLKKCRKLCDFLIVGVMTDEEVEKRKNFKPIIPYKQRALVVKNLKFVDRVVAQNTYSLEKNIKRYKPDKVFDNIYHARQGSQVLIPYTKGISSSLIKQKIYDTYNSQCQNKGWVVGKR